MKNTSASGFTFLELLIALAVAGILLSIGSPSVKAVIQNQRLLSTLGPVSLGAFSARSESAKSGDTVTVCARASDTQCGDDWNNGLLVFRDSAFDASETVAHRDADDEILHITPPHGKVTVTIGAIASSDRTAVGAYTPTFVRYRPDGRSNWKNGTFYACDERGSVYARALHITISGDIRPERRAESNVAGKDVFGRSLACS